MRGRDAKSMGPYNNTMCLTKRGGEGGNNF